MGEALIGAALQMVDRLRDHIERLDNGVAHAADDLAVVLRALLASGRGNDVLRRLFKETGFEPSEVILSAAPDVSDPDMVFAVGSIPTQIPEALADEGRALTVSQWMAAPVVTLKTGGDAHTYSWQKFLNDYANKWGGAHLDALVPHHLQVIDNHAAAQLSLSNYLLRCAGVETWKLAQDALRFWIHNLPEVDWGSDRSSIVGTGNGHDAPPRSRNELGKLQWYRNTRTEAGFLWYWDEDSSENSMVLEIAGAPYQIEVHAIESRTSPKVIPIQASRQIAYGSKLALPQVNSNTIRLNMRAIGLARLRRQAEGVRVDEEANGTVTLSRLLGSPSTPI